MEYPFYNYAMCRWAFILLLALPVLGQTPLDVGSHRELFVDGYVIEHMKGVELRLHEPLPGGTAIAFDKPWEGNTSAYATVFRDGPVYRMYYRGSADPRYVRRSEVKPGVVLTPAHPEFTCYAESPDGIRWRKPPLGLCEFHGSKANNILLTGDSAHDFAPFLDGNPNAPKDARYKAFGRTSKGLLAYASADAIHWKLLGPAPVITDGAFDSLNVGFWDSEHRRYVAVYRDFFQNVRSFKTATSEDFLHWTPGQWADFGDAPMEQLYTNAATPYFRAPQIYLAFPKRFIMSRTKLEDLSDKGVSEAVFLSSRDAVHWDRRFLEAFVRPGIDQRNWVHRNNMIAAGVVPASAGEISLYISRHYTFPSAYVERLTLRTDGFVSVHAGFRGGVMLTKPMRVKGKQLLVNYATSAAGSIRFELLDEHGNRLPGFEDPIQLWGDEIDQAIPLRRRGAPELNGSIPVRLRFTMKDADLYSFQFRE